MNTSIRNIFQKTTWRSHKRSLSQDPSKKTAQSYSLTLSDDEKKLPTLSYKHEFLDDMRISSFPKLQRNRSNSLANVNAEKPLDRRYQRKDEMNIVARPIQRSKSIPRKMVLLDEDYDLLDPDFFRDISSDKMVWPSRGIVPETKKFC
ncbi:hypothetical protein HK096_003743 [Nowakowskiella sp. JEL0078]|nr:hypothetical protein HK096_003743 [Nowakowskiella sp. JEL0078]